jgi:hypothetical protein
MWKAFFNLKVRIFVYNGKRHMSSMKFYYGRVYEDSKARGRPDDAFGEKKGGQRREGL